MSERDENLVVAIAWIFALLMLAGLIWWHIRQMLEHQRFMIETRIRRQIMDENQIRRLVEIKADHPGVYDDCETWEQLIDRICERHAGG